MKQSRLWVVISLVLVFAAGAAAGIFAQRCLFNPKPVQRVQSNRGPSPAEWEKTLGLSEEQKTQIHEIFKKSDVRIEELRSDFYKSEYYKEYSKRVGEIRAQLRKDINAVLTPEQKAKQDEMEKKFREARKKEADRRSAESSPRPKDSPSKENVNEKEIRDRSGDPGRRGRDYPGFFPF
jgi:Spy/CpxP family protein refolding chaperone